LSHTKTQLFSLEGRRIHLLEPYLGYYGGTIRKQTGPGSFTVDLDKPTDPTDPGMPIHLYRCEFRLPPLPQEQRRPHWLPDDFDGFVYADVPNF